LPSIAGNGPGGPASEATLKQGAALLGIYSFGLAVPFLLTALGIDRFLAFYSKFRRHLHRVEVASGVLLIGAGVLVFSTTFLCCSTAG
jgi:cytochrome c-type biogenesis protein